MIATAIFLISWIAILLILICIGESKQFNISGYPFSTTEQPSIRFSKTFPAIRRRGKIVSGFR